MNPVNNLLQILIREFGRSTGMFLALMKRMHFTENCKAFRQSIVPSLEYLVLHEYVAHDGKEVG